MSLKKAHPLEHDVTILSSVTGIEGNLYSKGNVRVDGIVKGNITTEGNLTLGEQSEVIGDAVAKNITLCGKFKGKLNSSDKIVIEKTANLEGDLIAKVLIIQEGAKFTGNSNMNGLKE
ncbi:MAG TPA: polymer-forming cytoskeletal protein [Melioribacteraceae bacterium]|nr:polymer-forming cytoskeletal protein [Melioribacteraceae bacterium]